MTNSNITSMSGSVHYNMGNQNPMHGKRHNEVTKRKISDSQKKRYERIRQALHEHFANTNWQSDVIKQCLENNEIDFNSIQSAINFLALLLGDYRLERIIDEKISNLVEENRLTL